MRAAARASHVGALIGVLALTASCNRQETAAPPSTRAGGAAGTQATAESPQESAAEDAPSDDAIAKVLEPWHGDLDEIVKRGFVRVLVTFSKTNYFLDKATQRGVSGTKRDDSSSRTRPSA